MANKRRQQTRQRQAPLRRNVRSIIMKKILLISFNLLFGNLIIMLLVSSNLFLQSLLINFQVYYHCIFSLLIVASSIYFSKKSEIITKRRHHFLFGFLTSFIPVAVPTLVLIGVSFIPASVKNEKTFEGISFVLRFSLIIHLYHGCSVLGTIWHPKLTIYEKIQLLEGIQLPSLMAGKSRRV